MKHKVNFIHFKRLLNHNLDRLAGLPTDQQNRAIYYFFLGFSNKIENAKIIAETNELHYFFGRHYVILTEAKTVIY